MSWTMPVASFWAGEDLSFVEQMVILSYLETGCDFTLYLGNEVGGIPKGTKTRPASEIMPRPAFLDGAPERKAMAVWADLFRVALLNRQEVIWVDLDAYCLRPYRVDDGYAFGLNGPDTMQSGVLALPQASPALQWTTAFLTGDELAPPWREEKWLHQRRKKGRLRAIDLPWGDTGPYALGHALRESGEIARGRPRPVYYPVIAATLPRLWQPGLSDARIITPETESVHIFGYTKRYLATYHHGLPPAESWLARTAHRHGLDPADAPARGEPLGSGAT